MHSLLMIMMAFLLTTGTLLEARGWKRDKSKSHEQVEQAKNGAAEARGYSAQMEKKLNGENNHHTRRMAKIDRVEELAREQENSRLMKKAQKMRAMEELHHANAMKRLQMEE